MGRLDGKVCVITGAASGIGAATARLFKEEGAMVVGIDLREDGVSDLALAADVTEPAQVEDMYAHAKKDYGRIDVLFNNVGISPDDDASVIETSLEAWQRVQDVNLKSVFLCCKHGIPHLLEAGGGSVINSLAQSTFETGTRRSSSLNSMRGAPFLEQSGCGASARGSCFGRLSRWSGSTHRGA